MRPDGAATRQHLFFGDVAVGRVFELGTRTLSEEEVIAFASEWDPQDFHVNPLAAARGPFDGLIASGRQTACVWMRLYVDAVPDRVELRSDRRLGVACAASAARRVATDRAMHSSTASRNSAVATVPIICSHGTPRPADTISPLGDANSSTAGREHGAFA
jgi:MaoC like domain